MAQQKILFIMPPFTHQNPRVKTFSVPLGLLYLAASAERHHIPRIVDLNFECEVEEAIREFDPDYIGISSFSPQFPFAAGLAAEIKRRFPDKMTVLGGVHATIEGPAILDRHPAFDYVLRGEGEHSLVKLLDGRNPSGIPGLVFRQDREIVDNGVAVVDDLDSLPFPARHLVHLDTYSDLPFYYLHHRHTSLMTSRGCPYSCIYCYRTPAKRYREHSPRYVLRELHHLKERGFSDFIFADDVFTLNVDRTEEICTRILDEGLNITWSCETRPDRVNPQLLRLMSRAGCHLLFYGIESGNQQVLNAMGKGITLDTIRRAVRDAKEAGIRVHAGFMLGFPFESEEQIDESVEFSKSIGLDGAEYTVVTPYPGTGLWKLAGYTDASDFSVLEELNYTQVMGNPFLDHFKLAGKYSQAITGFYFRRNIVLDIMRNMLTKGTMQRRWELFKSISFKGPAGHERPKDVVLPTTPTLIERFFKEQCQLCHGCDHTCKRRWLCYCQGIANKGLFKMYEAGLSVIERYDSLKKRNSKRDRSSRKEDFNRGPPR